MNSINSPSFTRRTFLCTSALAVASSRLAAGRDFAAVRMAAHLPARVVSAPDIPLPAGKR